jgi:hypothetical protein
MDPNVDLDIKAVAGAVIKKYVADQSPVMLVLADVADGTMLVELSDDDFAADVRRVAFLDAPTAGPSVQVRIQKLVHKNERVRVTTVGAGLTGQLRTLTPPLANLP